MRLAEFILANVGPIMQAWEDFARSLPRGVAMTVIRLRDDAERMLRFIAEDMETQQTPRQRFEKSTGLGPQPSSDDPSAAQDHGLARALDRFSLYELVSEYRALRASVLSLWLKGPGADQDVEQVIRFNEAVDQLIAESVERYSEKLDSDADTFTASIGHDLRNPLNAIAMSSTLLDSATLSDQHRNAVSQIRQSTMRMGAMLGELQDFSRTRLGGMLSFTRESVDIASLCERVIHEIRASTADCRIRFSRSGDTTGTVSAERTEQLMSNVIANAVQHGTAGGEVDVSVLGQPDDIVISVRNTGTPIPQEGLDRIFEPLYRGDTDTHEARHHLGLGLYIAKTIAVAHGGDIDVASTEEAGTIFRIRLPREP